jgi:hypothetical protein
MKKASSEEIVEVTVSSQLLYFFHIVSLKFKAMIGKTPVAIQGGGNLRARADEPPRARRDWVRNFAIVGV